MNFVGDHIYVTRNNPELNKFIRKFATDCLFGFFYLLILKTGGVSTFLVLSCFFAVINTYVVKELRHG